MIARPQIVKTPEPDVFHLTFFPGGNKPSHWYFNVDIEDLERLQLEINSVLLEHDARLRLDQEVQDDVSEADG